MPERIVPCKRPRVELVEQVTNPGTVVAITHDADFVVALADERIEL